MPTPSDFHEDIWNRVTVVTVTHDSGMVIGDFLASMNSSTRLVIVDNASTDDTLDIIAAKRPSATLIKNKENLGYGSGCNCGLDVVETEFSILANPDSIFSEDAVIKMLDTANRYQDVGLIGPTMLNSDGRVELSHDVELWKRDSYRKRNDELTAEGELCAEFISGAVVLVRMTAIREINGFDREFFLYYEDDDMCLNLRRHGWKLLLVANAVVTHIGGGSVRINRHYHWKKFWNIAWSRLYIEKKYHGTFAMIRLAVANIVKFTFKAVGYFIIFKRKKAWRDLARSAGSISALLGIRASKLPWAPRNPQRDNVKAVILAGGLGSRLSEENRPKAKANDRNQRAASSVAHHENL